jgi:hypothetical protein
MPEPQSYTNHRRFVPLYHFVAVPLFTVNLGWALYRLGAGYPGFEMPLFDRLLAVAVAAALILTVYYARVFALRAQDRAIRLEERARLAALLPDDLQPRLSEVRASQLIGLRFASDGEVPELVRRIVAGELKTRKEIKQAIRSWRPDRMRL